MEYTNKKNNPGVNLRDSGGITINFHPTESETTEIDISNGYVPESEKAIRNGFWICPLTTGTINVRLLNQKDTTRSLPIPTERVDANLGQWMDEKCVEIVKSGTTVTRALIAWNE